MNIKLLTDEELWNGAIKETEVERNSTLRVISFLEEIQFRKLHLKRGYSSLHEYCVSVLKYSDGGASRRIGAMKLVRELPETRKSIENGALSLTTASQIQQVIEKKAKKNEPLAKEEKIDLFLKLEGKSKREVEKTIADICPEIIKKNEKQRYVGENRVQVTYVIPERLHSKIEKLKKLRARENKEFLVIYEELIDKDIQLHDPMARKVTPRKKTTPPAELKTHSRYVRIGDETRVWQKANAQCEFIDPLTGKRCEATHYLELDHIIPFALGGPTTTENLRLLCSSPLLSGSEC
jgi:5-methylcytosine-specific restriction endonuclease McrA